MKAAFLLTLLFSLSSVFAQDVVNNTTLFSDNFSTNSNQWPINSEGGATYKLRDGKYAMENTDGKSTIVTIPIKGLADNYSLSTACMHSSGISNNNFGLYFASLNNANGYVFGISKDGSYIVFRYVNNQSEVLIKWTAHASIKKEEGAKNVLKIKADGSNFEFYINDTYVNSLSGYKPYGNRAGFIVSANQRVEFDDLLVQSADAVNENKFKDALKNLSDDYDFFNLLYAGEKELLHDKFTTATGWVYDKNEFAIADSKLSSKSVAGKTYTAGKMVALDPQKDYSIAVYVQHYAGLSNYGYGLQVGDNYHNLQFRISKNGLYTIASGTDKLVPWTQSTYVKQADLATNKLEIEKTAGKIKFNLNGQLLYTYVATLNFSPFWVQPLVDEAQTILFTDLVIRGSDAPPSNTIVKQTTDEKKTVVEELPVDSKDAVKPMSMVFFDGFYQGSNTHWVYDSSRTKIQNGKLIIHALKGIANLASHYETLQTTADFEAAVETKHISGTDNYGYGLRLGSSDNALIFEITQNGFFQVYDGAKAIVKWTKNSAVKTASGEVNKLMIKKYATYIEFFCNETLLYKYDAVPVFDKFNIMLSTSDEQAVEFDNVELNGTDADPINWG